MKPIQYEALLILNANRKNLTTQQYKTLRGQVLSGNAEGAIKGLNKLTKEKK
jgi:hypothetical protein